MNHTINHHQQINTLTHLFKKYSQQKPARLTSYELMELIGELQNKPKQDQVNHVFITNPDINQNGLDQQTFIFWYYASILGLHPLTSMFIGLRKFGQKIKSLLPAQPQDHDVKHSFIKLLPNVEMEQYHNEVNFDIIFGTQKAQSKLKQYQQILKKPISQTSIILDFKVNGDAELVKQKLEGTILHGKQLAKQFLGDLAEGVLKFLNITCANTETQVILVIQTDYVLLNLLTNQFNNILGQIDSKLVAEFGVFLKTSSIQKIINDVSSGLSSSFVFDLKINKILMGLLKQIILQNENKKINQHPLRFLLTLLIEQIQLQVKTNDIKSQLQNTLGIPELKLQDKASQFKNNVQLSQILDSFLPQQSQQLVGIIKNAVNANVKIEIFLGGLNISLGLKLNETNKVFDMIM